MKNDISELIGKTLLKIDKQDDEITFFCSSGEAYKLYHSQDCCESVCIEDIVGDLDDLIGASILKASEDTSEVNPEGIVKDDQDSFTWTFYNFATTKGYVTIRFYGESNGYYSESVDFVKLNQES